MMPLTGIEVRVFAAPTRVIVQTVRLLDDESRRWVVGWTARVTVGGQTAWVGVISVVGGGMHSLVDMRALEPFDDAAVAAVANAVASRLAA